MLAVMINSTFQTTSVAYVAGVKEIHAHPPLPHMHMHVCAAQYSCTYTRDGKREGGKGPFKRPLNQNARSGFTG